MNNSQKLAAYCARIGLSSPPPVSAEGLLAMQAAHRQSIGFENLDIMLGRPIKIGSCDVFAKLVTAQRGGYCFEHNQLFADMLSAAGFSCRLLLARIKLGNPPEAGPRIHCLVLVEFAGEHWIADAGFGGAFAPPMPLQNDELALSADGAQHRLQLIGADKFHADAWLLERQGPAEATDGRAGEHGWQPQYSFDLTLVEQADLELGNYWPSNFPEGRFTNFHVVSLCLEGGFASMVDRKLTIYHHGSDVERREIANVADYGAALREVFGLDLGREELARLPLFAGT